MEGCTSKFESKTVRKTEGAIEEKLRALLSDLERWVEPILGHDSRVMKYLQELITIRNTTTTTMNSNASSSKLSCLLLIDQSLQSLPWEGLQFANLFEGEYMRLIYGNQIQVTLIYMIQ